MAKFINPFTDIGFKRIFGQEVSKPVLLKFLNILLEGERHILDLNFLDKEQLGESAEDRSLIYDVYCEVEGGEHIIVEMQNRSQPFFKERSVYYMSRAISNQGTPGPTWHYCDVKAVYMNSNKGRIGGTWCRPQDGYGPKSLSTFAPTCFAASAKLVIISFDK